MQPSPPLRSPRHEPASVTPVGDPTAPVREVSITADRLRAHAFLGGRGTPLLLVHGGWGGAATHFGPVLEPLSERFQVIAPDLPGIGDLDQPGLGSLAAYAKWLRALLDALDVPSAWLVGNSLGVSVICRLALDFPERCRGMVFVNGFPMPETPPLLRRLGERRFGRRLLAAIEKRVAYTPSALARGFVDPEKVPDALRALVRQKKPSLVSVVADVMVQGGGAPGAYPAPPLLLWGQDDHLPGTSARAARRLHASYPGATLTFVRNAGHLPQIENPNAFVDALTAFVEKA
jgi:pimeloyl-ACP methyl ester carboxylesterase